MYTKWHYRAFEIDSEGKVLSGIEEWILARTEKEAKRIAWRRAGEILDCSRIQMDYVREGAGGLD